MIYLLRMPDQGSHQQAIAGAPHARLLIVAGSYQILAITGELRMLHSVFVLQREQQPAIGNIPYPCCFFVTNGDNSLAIGREYRSGYGAVVVQHK